MQVKSITMKQIVKGKSSTTFTGRLFYAIIPDNVSKSITFCYTRANAQEGLSVTQALPLFVWDLFKLDPDFFCSSDTLTECLDDEWDLQTRVFLSPAEKE